MKTFYQSYNKLISIENIFQAWNEFKKGKRKRLDIQVFERKLEDNLFELYESLKNRTYQHGQYVSFYVNDPKQRHIHKASVRDRIIHHLLYKYLYELFDKSFIYDSYSCRFGKGTHKGVIRLERFTKIVSKNYTKPCWILKGDIKKFFASVDHQVLFSMLRKRIKDENILWLLFQLINSFHSEVGNIKGIPLGNLTSQVFANIYMNKFDQYVKHQLGIRCYLRYADDFLTLSDNKEELQQHVYFFTRFLEENLKLQLHPQKIIFRRLDWGVDFLGYVILPYYRLPRTKTKRRIFKKLKNKIGSANFNQSLESYLGYFSHTNNYKLIQNLKNQIWYWRNLDTLVTDCVSENLFMWKL